MATKNSFGLKKAKRKVFFTTFGLLVIVVMALVLVNLNTSFGSKAAGFSLAVCQDICTKRCSHLKTCSGQTSGKEFCEKFLKNRNIQSCSKRCDSLCNRIAGFSRTSPSSFKSPQPTSNNQTPRPSQSGNSQTPGPSQPGNTIQTPQPTQPHPTQSADSTAQKGTFTSHVLQANGRQYLLYLPGNYDQAPEGGWPTIVFFHGAGIPESTGVTGILQEALPQAFASGQATGFIVIAPRMYRSDFPGGDSGWLTPTALNTMFELLNDLQGNYKINPKRISVSGYSLGGAAAWNMAFTKPDRFAAVAPVAGFYRSYVTPTKPDNPCVLYNKPVRAFHGSLDSSISIAHSQTIIQTINDCGGPDTATLVQGAWSHDSISGQVFSASSGLYSWLSSQHLP